MEIKEIIDGLQFTVDMFLCDPSTGEVLKEEQLNEDNRTTVDACNGAIKAIQKLQAIEENKPPTDDWERYADRLHDIAYKNGYEQAIADQEPCEDAISRKDLMRHLRDCKTENAGIIQAVIVAFESYVELMPSVTPARPKGHWIEMEVRQSPSLVCSVCGSDLGSICEKRFCPNCGAEMKGDNDADCN